MKLAQPNRNAMMAGMHNTGTTRLPRTHALAAFAASLLLVLAASDAARAQAADTPAPKPAAEPAPVAPAAPVKDDAPAPGKSIEPVKDTAPVQPDIQRGSTQRNETSTKKSSKSKSSKDGKSSSKDRSSKSAPSGAKFVPGTTELTFDSFRGIPDRNIFNPNRYARGSQEDAAPPPPPPARVETFALVGTLSYATNQLAFFDSENSAMRKTCKPGDDIAGHKLTEIGGDQVKLAVGEQETALKVGFQMSRSGTNAWVASLRPERVDEGNSSSGADGDVMRRLMEQRMRESGGSSSSRYGDRGSSSSGSSRYGDRGSSSSGSSRYGSDRDRGGPPPSAPAPAPAPASPPLSPSAESEILKKLMEQRQKENSK